MTDTPMPPPPDGWDSWLDWAVGTSSDDDDEYEAAYAELAALRAEVTELRQSMADWIRNDRAHSEEIRELDAERQKLRELMSSLLSESDSVCHCHDAGLARTCIVCRCQQELAK